MNYDEQKILDDLKTQTITQASEKYDIPKWKIYSIFRKHNPNGRLSKRRLGENFLALTYGSKDTLTRRKEVIRRRKEGWSFAAIGRKLGVSRQRAREIYQQFTT